MSMWLDCDDDERPTPDGIRHSMTDVDGLLVCCGTEAVAIPPGDAMTSDPERVTCGVKA